MPREKDLKRRVRERMRKTGESYTAARAQIVARKVRPRQEAAAPRLDHAELAGMSDAAVAAKTGHAWAHWVRVLDRANATALPHREIAKLLREEHGLTFWWSQTVTVAYERVRGLREPGQRRGGGYDVNKSKTVPVPVAELYAAFGARRRKQWLGDVSLRIKKATPAKSMRLTWEDGLPVDVHFCDKGPTKSQLQLQHRALPTRAAADRARAEWTARLDALARHLSRQKE